MTAIDIYVYAAPFLVILGAVLYARFDLRNLRRLQAELDERKQPGE